MRRTLRRRAVLAALSLQAAGPFPARAQRGEVRRVVGVLSALAATDPVAIARLAALRAELASLGWMEGRNLTIEAGFGAGSAIGAEVAGQAVMRHRPDVLVVQGPAVPVMRSMAGSTPIVFVVVADPVGNGLIESMARPGGTMTGFSSGDVSLGGKWLDLLHEVAPRVRQVGVMGRARNRGYDSAIAVAARRAGLSVDLFPVEDSTEIAAALDRIAAFDAPGLLLPTDALTPLHRRIIIDRCLGVRIPLVTGNPPIVQDGGLLYYGADVLDQFRMAAHYVDRILRGARAADLPVQLPTRFELVLNLRTAGLLDLAVPPGILAMADAFVE